METSTIEYNDIQGLVRFGHGHLKGACFILLGIEKAEAARDWLAATPMTTAEKIAPPPTTALQVAFTCEGLRELGVPENVIKGFSQEFTSGMARDESRSRRLGDVGANDPYKWGWGGPHNTPHLMLMLYAEKERLEEQRQALVERLTQSGFNVLDCLMTSDLHGIEPFGFKDGISQPKIDWGRERKVDGGDQLDYGNLVTLGEFLLGYPNEYGKYTDRPLLDPSENHAAILPDAEDRPGMRDLGRNGTYLVHRQLSQDLRGFWKFLDHQANSDPVERQRLAETLVGRTMSGDPLVPMTGRAIPGVDGDADDIKFNQFTYESDEAGTRCPFGAHVRRANPRNADLAGGRGGLFHRLSRMLGFGHKSIRDDLVASTRFHRILRRGREYGISLAPEDAVKDGQTDGEGSGLHFICLNANIARQFEFVQSAWVMSTKFDGLTEESDPLLGNREPVTGCRSTDTYSIPQKAGARRRITGLPQFVTVRGGAYFFLPGIRALSYIVKAGG